MRVASARSLRASRLYLDAAEARPRDTLGALVYEMHPGAAQVPHMIPHGEQTL